jgi:hypothetical protein
MAQWRDWVTGPFQTLLKTPDMTASLHAWILDFHEEITDCGVTNEVLLSFASHAGFMDVDVADVLSMLAAYRARRGLSPDFGQLCFQVVPAAPRAGGPGGSISSDLPNAVESHAWTAQDILALLQQAQSVAVNNRQDLTPPLDTHQVAALGGQQVPYRWMSSMILAFQELAKQEGVEGAVPPWRNDPFVLAIWRLLHEELRVRDMGGRPPPMPHPGPRGPLHRQGPCFKCGAVGHWSRDCQGRFASGAPTGVQVMGDTPVFVSRQGKVFDPSGPPPSPCFRCGQLHWSFQPCPQGALGTQQFASHSHTGHPQPNVFSPSQMGGCPPSSQFSATQPAVSSGSVGEGLAPFQALVDWLATQPRGQGGGGPPQ